MRQVNVNVLSAADNQTTIGSTIDSNQLVASSFQAVFGDAQAAGTFKLQASNDVAPIQYSSNTTFIPTHWVDVPNMTANVTAGGSKLLTIAQTSYRWLRAVYTSTATGAQTITTIADESAVAQIADITCNDDTSVYAVSSFTFPALADATGGDYVVFYRYTGQAFAVALNVSGTDPDPTGAIWLSVGSTQRVNVDISSAITANDVANIIAAVIPTIPQFDGVVGTVVGGNFTITQAYPAPTPSSTVHNADDSGIGSILATAPSPQGVVGLNNTYFLLYSAQDLNTYYVWYNVDSLGVDPMVMGAIGIMVAISSGDTAATVAVDSTGPISIASAGVPFNANSFMSDLLIYNQQTGPATMVADGATPTGFAFATSVPGSDAGIHLNNNYFFINAPNAGTAYYVWYNVAGGGTDPMIAGKTGIEVDVAASDTADTVATLTAAALDALAAFVSTATTNVVTVTNANSGPFIPASDFDTSFAFAVTAGGSTTVNVNMFALGA